MSDDVQKLAESIKKLKIEYDRYFLGLDRMEPAKSRDAVKKDLRRLVTETNNNNTARRFRLQSLQATLLTHEVYWDRTARQIEEGTYKRDKLRAKALMEASADEDAAPAPVARAQPAEEFPEAIKKLHEAYEQARIQSGDSREVPIGALAATVRKQVAAIKAQYNCKTVEFKVTIKDGKPILKAVPKN